MYLRKQVKIFCAANGSSNYDELKHPKPATRQQLINFMNMHKKKCEMQYQKMNGFLKYRNPIFQRTQQLITQLKLSLSHVASDSLKAPSTKASFNKTNNSILQIQNIKAQNINHNSFYHIPNQLQALQLSLTNSTIVGNILDDLVTEKSQIIQSADRNMEEMELDISKIQISQAEISVSIQGEDNENKKEMNNLNISQLSGLNQLFQVQSVSQIVEILDVEDKVLMV